MAAVRILFLSLWQAQCCACEHCTVRVVLLTFPKASVSGRAAFLMSVGYFYLKGLGNFKVIIYPFALSSMKRGAQCPGHL